MATSRRLIPSLALLAVAWIATAMDDFNLQLHGYVSEGYLLTRNNALFTPQSEDQGTFQFNEFGLTALARPIDRLRVAVQIYAQDLGDNFNDKLQLDYAYGDYSAPTLGGIFDVGIKAGRFKLTQGLYNEYRDLDMTRTSVFLPMSIYDPRFRDFVLAANGVSLYGTLKSGPLGSFDFTGYIGAQNIDAKEGSIRDIMTDSGMDLARVDISAFEGGSLTWNTPLDGLRFRYSMLDARDVDIRGTTSASGAAFMSAAIGGIVPASQFLGLDRTVYLPHYWNDIASVEFQRGNVVFSGEYSYTYYKSLSSIDLPAGAPPQGVGGGTQQIVGYQASHAVALLGSYRIVPKVDVQGGWQWSASNGNDSSQGERKSKWYGWNAAIRYDIMDHWLVKAEYMWLHGYGPTRDAEQSDGTRENIWGYFALKTTFDF